jgi:hypothetical protein
MLKQIIITKKNETALYLWERLKRNYWKNILLALIASFTFIAEDVKYNIVLSIIIFFFFVYRHGSIDFGLDLLCTLLFISLFHVYFSWVWWMTSLSTFTQWILD